MTKLICTTLWTYDVRVESVALKHAGTILHTQSEPLLVRQRHPCCWQSAQCYLSLGESSGRSDGRGNASLLGPRVPLAALCAIVPTPAATSWPVPHDQVHGDNKRISTSEAHTPPAPPCQAAERRSQGSLGARCWDRQQWVMRAAAAAA